MPTIFLVLFINNTRTVIATKSIFVQSGLDNKRWYYYLRLQAKRSKKQNAWPLKPDGTDADFSSAGGTAGLNVQKKLLQLLSKTKFIPMDRVLKLPVFTPY